MDDPEGHDPGADGPARRPTFVIVGLAGAALTAVVIVVAFLTGTADDLPWGAIIGIGILLVAMAVVARRRRRALERHEDEGG
ncbi:MAG: LPXTG cell wall anchor domain-containing protein [Thermoleophilia bacterium]